MKLFFLSAALLLFFVRSADSSAATGQWNCVSTSPAGWTRCTGWISAYSRKILVYFPAQSGPASRIYLHLHGYRIRHPEDDNFVSMMEGFSLPRLADSAGISEGLIVVPESIGECATYIHELQGNFESFYSSLLREVGALVSLDARRMRVTLSGHSGAFFPIQNIIRGRGTGASRIDRIVFLDATYRSLDVDALSNWMERGGHSLYSAYLEGSATETASERIRNRIPDARVEALPSRVGHWGTVLRRFGRVAR